MMKVEWNQCFLCLNDLGKPDGKEVVSSGKRKGKLKVLFRYLLESRNGVHGSVLEDIFRGLDEEGLSFPGVRLCGNCERLAVKIGDLHEELEVVQMKIINGLERVKEVVRRNSKIYGSNDGARVGLEVFEEWLNEEELGGINHPNERKMLENLMAFQTAVFEKDKDSVEIPRVFLDKYSYVQPNSYVHKVEGVVKTEASDDSNSDLVDAALRDLKDDYSPMSFHDDCDLEQSPEAEEMLLPVPKIELPSKISPKKKRKNNTNMEGTIKTEHFVDEEDFPSETKPIDSIIVEDADFGTRRRKTRTAASLASQRITEINHSSEDNLNFIQKELQNPKTTVKLTKSKTDKTSLSHKSRPNKSYKSDKEKITKKKSNRGRRAMALPSFATKSKHKGQQKSRHRVMFSCDTESCDFTTISAYKFEHHLRDHETAEKFFTCDKCADNRSFSGKQLYQFHMASHDGYNKIRCDICNRIFLAVDIIGHMKSHVEKVFPCPNCSHCSSTRDKYLTHLREHGTKGKLWCDLCDLIFHSRHKLLSHLHDKHKAIEKIACNFEDCKKTFLDVENLKLHQKIHTQPFVCPVCQKCFIDASRLKIHQIAHTGEKPFQCEQCTESFVNNANLQRHLIREHGAEKFKCDVCGNEYSCKQSLIAHKVVHDGTGIPCGFPGCDKTFGNRTLWRRHQSFHSTEKNFVCEECGQRLKTAAKLRKHMLIHNGEKKFKCPHCDKAFVMNKYLVNHVRIHTGEKPFVCDLCGKAFNQYAALYMHKRKHLGDGAPPVNPDAGRPRVNQLQSRKQSTVSCRVPAEMDGVFPMDISSRSNDIFPTLFTSGESRVKEEATEMNMTSIKRL